MKQAYIFSYGSLMLKQEIERTLHRPLLAENLIHATLIQHMRAWSAERENSQSDHKWLLNRYSGVLPEYITYLNIEHEPHHKVLGMIFLIDEIELAGFDHREVGYQRVDVSAFIQTDQPLKFPVYTYMDQDELHIREGSNVALSLNYMNLIRNICQCLDLEFGVGMSENYLHQTYLPNAQIDNLDVVYFNKDFSQLFELRIDRQPMKICMANISATQQIVIEQSWLDSLEVNSFRMSGDWRERFVLACLGDQTDHTVKILKNDPCMLVRWAFEYQRYSTTIVPDTMKHIKKGMVL